MISGLVSVHNTNYTQFFIISLAFRPFVCYLLYCNQCDYRVKKQKNRRNVLYCVKVQYKTKQKIVLNCCCRRFAVSVAVFDI